MQTNKITVQHFQLTALAQLPLLLDVDYMNTASFNCEMKNCQLLICYTLPYHWEEYNLHTQVTQSSAKDESEASVQCFCPIDATVIVVCGCIVCFVTWWWVFNSVRPSTPFSADTDTPIFCCQSNTIPIRYRFFNTLQERSWCRVTDRSKTADAAAATNNSGAPRTRCSAAADAFDLSWTVKHSNYQ